MKMFNGRQVADKILSELKRNIQKRGLQPKLAVILIGDNKASQLYIRLKRQAAQRVGIKLTQYSFEKKSKEKEVIGLIKLLNANKSVHGILVQLPLPQGFNTNKIIKTISSVKDVDGFHSKKLDPVLPSAILIALRQASRNLKKKKILALVNSEIFGKTLKSFLAKRGIHLNYTLKKEKKYSADVLITVRGQAKSLKGEMIKQGVVLVDAGSPPDIDQESVKNKASFLTPVPGGIGPLTVALLLQNVYLATKKYAKHS